jgi:hypothetical protein|tara:strand:+ start:2831 stop:3532 length:702 start_codon:yes stop_codon:yes gene_type:complete
MSISEQIAQMKNEKVPEEEIIKKLQDQGVSPKSINDTLNQMKIKDAVSKEDTTDYSDYEMSPSPTHPLKKAQTQEIADEGEYSPNPQENDQSQKNYIPPPQGYGAQEEYIPQDYSQYQDEASYSPRVDTSTIIEISEQVFSEKMQKMQAQIEGFSEFKTLSESKIENFSERLKRIELIIDKLQTSILEKVGSYGSGLESVKKEMSMMQDSFGKVVGSVVEKNRKRKTKKTKKK